MGDQTVTSSFVYSSTSTPQIKSISPVRGGSGGGTHVTITGSAFPYEYYFNLNLRNENKSSFLYRTDMTLLTVKIGVDVCSVLSSTSATIVCVTGAHTSGSYLNSLVSVAITNIGLALNVSN